MNINRSQRFEAWWTEYHRTGSLESVRLGMIRDELRQLFGEPDDTANGFRKQPQTGIWKYGDVEFHFGLTGELWLINAEDEGNNPCVIAKRTD